jgi:hypothetical protein
MNHPGSQRSGESQRVSNGNYRFADVKQVGVTQQGCGQFEQGHAKDGNVVCWVTR